MKPLSRTSMISTSCALVCGVLVTGMFATSANAFQRTLTCIPGGSINACGAGEEPRPLYWPTSCVTYHIHDGGTVQTDNERAYSAIRASFEAWNEVDCSYQEIEFGGYTNEDRVGYNPNSNNANIVVFRDTGWTHSSGILALTSVTFKASSGEIFDADIEMNSAEYRFTTTDNDLQVLIDVQNTITHEAGHFVGLDHSAEPESTMYATAPLKETRKRSLHEDDIEGYCEIYPVAANPTRNGCWGAPVGYFEKPLYGPGDDTPVEEESPACACSTPARSTSKTPWGLAVLGALVVFGSVLVRRSR